VNTLKHEDCASCINLGRGVRIFVCKSCDWGENFEPTHTDTLDQMRLSREDEKDVGLKVEESYVE